MADNNTFDNKRQIKPLTLLDVDKAFFDWWNDKLNLHLQDKDGSKKKVPVHFVHAERWNLARQEGFRDRHGTIILPVIVIARTRIGGSNEEPFNRIIADTKKDFVYHKKINPKSSLIKELNKNREWNIDPSLPIYEVYTARVPDHYVLTYEVSIWPTYSDDMNRIIEKIGQQYDYLSVKCFKFETPDGFYFRAFQNDELTDDSNMDDFTEDERIIRKTIGFNVPAYIMPDNDEKKSPFKRFLSQSKLVFKSETIASDEEIDKIFGKK